MPLVPVSSTLSMNHPAGLAMEPLVPSRQRARRDLPAYWVVSVRETMTLEKLPPLLADQAGLPANSFRLALFRMGVRIVTL